MDVLPLISVVIPCHNHGQYLADAITSVRQACLSRLVEVIVVDDGSTDDTRDVAAVFRNVRLISQPASGVVAARNRGLSDCRAPLVVFLDADDCLAPAGLDAAASALEWHPECAFVYGRCLMMSPEGTTLPTPAQPRVARDHYRELLRRNYIWMPAMAMFRRDLLQRIGGFSGSVPGSSDYDLYLRLARTCRVHDHGAVVACYRQHTVTSTGDAARMLRDTLTVLRQQRPYVKDNVSLARAYEEGRHRWQEFYGAHLVNEIRDHVQAREWGRAFRKAATLGRLHPDGLRHHTIEKLRAVATRRSLAEGRTGCARGPQSSARPSSATGVAGDAQRN